MSRPTATQLVVLGQEMPPNEVPWDLRTDSGPRIRVQAEPFQCARRSRRR